MESHNAINTWVAGKQTYKVNRRKEYGPSATSTQVRQVRAARFWTDKPFVVSLKQELLDKKSQLEAEHAEIEKIIESKKSELATIQAQHTQKKNEKVCSLESYDAVNTNPFCRINWKRKNRRSRQL